MFTWNTVFLAFLVVLIVLAPLTAGDFAALVAKAEKGDIAAQFELGRRYLDDKQEKRAFAWFKKAAAQGVADAEVMVASMYGRGAGVPKDWTESTRWYRLAAAKGHPDGQHHLGIAYEQGHGVHLDVRQAARWYRKAAEQGHADAQYRLGKLYEAGKGVPQSELDAYAFYLRAAKTEGRLGVGVRDYLDLKLIRSESKLSPAQREEAERRVAKALALAAVHPRKFGTPGSIGKIIGRSRGWFVWLKWNPDTWEAEVTTDPPGDVFKTRVLPWATTYRHLAYGGRFDELLPGEKMNMFFDPDENHRRGYVVHFQDEISQMKGHGHAWKVLEAPTKDTFTAQIFAGAKPVEDKKHTFAIDPACRKWSRGKMADEFPWQPGDRIYMTWVYRDKQRVVMLLTDDASLDTLKKLETERIEKQVAAEGMAGRLENVDKEQVQIMIYATHWAQAGQLRPGQTVRLATTGTGYRPTEVRLDAKVLSQKNRGIYGSGVNDVMLHLLRQSDAAKLLEWEDQTLRLIPGN